MRKPTVDWLAGLAAVGAQWRACTAATRRRSRVGLVSGGSAWATSALCKLCMMGPVLMLHGLVLLLADGTVPEPPGMARVTGGELNLKYTPESGMLLAGSQWCAGAAPDSKLLESVAPHVNATELASHETTGSGRARPRQPRKGVAASDRRAEVFRAVREQAHREAKRAVVAYYPIEVIVDPGSDTRDPLRDYFIEVKHANGHVAGNFVGRPDLLQ